MYIRLTPPAGVAVRKIAVPRRGGKIPALVISPERRRERAPVVLWIHGGGFITGMKEMVFMSRGIDLVTEFGAVVVSPGYRLSPAAPYPAAIDDCHAVLRWTRDHCRALGGNPDQIMVGGESAGGGLCAALCMLARDRGTVGVACQMPLYPMLDNFDTPSSRDNHGRIWNTKRNHFGWACYLRADARAEVSPYAAPARQTDHAALPPCYTFVGDGEPFYSETLTYVQKLRAAGVEAEADVYHSDVHAFDMLWPESENGRRAAERFREHFAYAEEHYFAANDIRER